MKRFILQNVTYTGMITKHSARRYFKIINPQRACARGLVIVVVLSVFLSVCLSVCLSCSDFGDY